MRAALIWGALGAALIVPLWIAATSPLLQWRQPIYIVGGFAGVLGLSLMAMQPLLAAGLLPGLPPQKGRRVHIWIGAAIVICVIFHVAGLWIASPPDVIDALTFASPTPFAVWGVLAMWAVFASALLASQRRRWRLPPRIWRRVHTALAVIIVGSTAAHAMLIEGTMGTLSKAALCLLLTIATIKVIYTLRIWFVRRRV